MADDLTPEQTVGNRLRQLREDFYLSQRHVAEIMNARGHRGWRQGTVSTTEAGQRPLRVNELVTLAAIFNVSLDQLAMRNVYDGLSLADAQAELAKLTAELESVDAELAKARDQVQEANERVRGLEYHRTEIARLAQMLQEHIERVSGDERAR